MRLPSHASRRSVSDPVWILAHVSTPLDELPRKFPPKSHQKFAGRTRVGASGVFLGPPEGLLQGRVDPLDVGRAQLVKRNAPQAGWTYPALVDRVTLTDSGFADHLLSNSSGDRYPRCGWRPGSTPSPVPRGRGRRADRGPVPAALAAPPAPCAEISVRSPDQGPAGLRHPGGAASSVSGGRGEG